MGIPNFPNGSIGRWPLQTTDFTAHASDTYFDHILPGQGRGEAVAAGIDSAGNLRLLLNDEVGIQQVSILSKEAAFKLRRVIDAVVTMPGAWVTAVAVTVGSYVTVAGGAILRATVAGTTGAAEPVAPAEYGGTVVDGTVTWERVG